MIIFKKLTRQILALVFFCMVNAGQTSASSSLLIRRARLSSEQALFVNEDPYLLNLKRKDGEWRIETQSDRVLLITFPDNESKKELIDSLTIYDGADPNESSILFPSVEYNSTNVGASQDRLYSNSSAVSIRYRYSEALQSSNTKFQLKFEKAVPCPANLGDDSSSCERVVDDVSCYCATFSERTWESTKTFCSDNKMTFLRIDDYNEDLKVYQTWAGQGNPWRHFWLGASDLTKEGNFTWDNGGKPISPGYTNWGNGEPNNLNEAEDCAHYHSLYFYWNDVSCQAPFGGICESQP